MDFKQDAPLDANVLHKAKQFMHTLPSLRSGEYFNHMYLHWPVEPFGCVDGAYNVEVVMQGDKWTPIISHDPRDNAVDITDGPYAAHTWHRNSHGLGLAIAGMDGATASNFGPDGIQQHELEMFLAIAAACCHKYGIDASTSDGIMTHAEAAAADGYFGERWDLARLQGSSAPLTVEEAHHTADQLRHRIHLYKLEMK